MFFITYHYGTSNHIHHPSLSLSSINKNSNNMHQRYNIKTCIILILKQKIYKYHWF